MSNKSLLLKGTFILTFAGFFTRIMGFFFRIFLSRIFSAEEIGLYQLIFPVYTLVFSFTSAGLQTALSRCTANYFASNKKDKAIQSLKVALSFSISVSLIFIFIIQKNASFLSENFLGDARCYPLLIIMTYAFPFAAIHSCFCGFCLGQRASKPVAFSQLIEQTFRILSVSFFIYVYIKNGSAASINIAVWGIVIGEIASAFYLVLKHQTFLSRHGFALMEYTGSAAQLFRLAAPLTANRVSLNLMQSIEAISIPLKLQEFGLSSSDSLSLYGIFSGMALPCILFPSAITNALSSMLLPTIAEFQVSRTSKDLKMYVRKIIGCCFFMGLTCSMLFLLSAGFIGEYVFHNELVSRFITALSFICPFLYTNTTLLSIINGLGKTSISFGINLLALLIRIGCVFILIPLCGFQGYFYGLLASQLLITTLSYTMLKHIL